jgi:hypothetical protein
MVRMKCGDNGGLSRLTGLPCGRDVPRGFRNCFLHGGATPGAKMLAERTLAAARMPAIEALHKILHDWGADVCDKCGRPNYENAHPVIRAAQIILDRTGFGPKATIEVTKPGDDGGLDIELLTPGERDRLAGLLGQLRELKDQVRARLAGGDEAEVLGLAAAAPAALLGEVVSPLGENDAER